MSRRRLTPYLCLAVLVLGLGFGIGLGLSEAPNRPPQQPAITAVFPMADAFNQIAVDAGHVTVTGELAATVNQTNPTCIASSVNRTTLRIGHVIHGSCSDPATSGQLVGPVTKELAESNDATFSLATINPTTGSISLGPALFTFCNCSGGRPVLTFGGQWLWVFDDTVVGPELFQASATTGQVVDSFVLPSLYRPDIAAGDGGLWIGNSLFGGTCAGCQHAAALYFVAPGASAPVAVVARTDLQTCWVVTDQAHVWVGIVRDQQGCEGESIWKFVGSSTVPAFEARNRKINGFSVVGNETNGLWSLQWMPRQDREQAVGIDPDTGDTDVVTLLPRLVPPPSGEFYGGIPPSAAVVDRGSLFVLQPPIIFGGYWSLLRFPLDPSDHG